MHNNVEQRNMLQWFFRITDYAERLNKNLDVIDWAEITKTAQRNWIGRSEGAEIDFDENNMMGGGFKINNPNAKGTCGCGSSFEPK